MAISFYLNRQSLTEYAYVSGTVIKRFEPGSLHEISEDIVRNWSAKKKAFRLGGKNGPDDRVFQELNSLARSVGLHSLMIAPIRWRGEIIGDLVLCAFEKEAYSDGDLKLVDMLADKISGVVANAQALSQARLESGLRESLLELSRLISSVRSLHEIQEQFGEIACSLVGADRVAISIPDAANHVVENVLVYGFNVEGYDSGSRAYESKFDTIPWLQTQKSYIADDTAIAHSDKTTETERIMRISGLNSTLVTPIVWQGNSIAVIMFRACAEAAFNESHLEKATAIANQVAGAIANQIAYQMTRHESRTRELLARISREVSSSQSLVENFNELGEMITDLIPSDRLSIVVMTEPGAIPSSLGEYGLQLQDFVQGTIPRGMTGEVSMRLQRDPVPMVLDGTQPDISTDYALSLSFSEPVGLKSWMVAPVMWNSKLLGIIHFRSRQELAYGRIELELAGQVAQQIAGTMANQIAYQNLQRESRVRELLAQISRAISSSQKMDATFDNLGKLITTLIPSDRLTITLWAKPGDPPIAVYGYGVKLAHVAPGSAMSATGEVRRLLADNPVPTVIDENDPRVPGDVAATSVFSGPVGLRSWMVAPLVWRHELLGIIHFRSRQELAYGPAELDLAGQVSVQIAGSIADNIAFQKLKTDATIRYVLAELSIAVGSNNNIATVLPKIDSLTGSVIEFDGITIGTYDPEREMFRHLYTRGVRSAERPVEPIFHISDLIAGDAIRKGEVQSVSIGSIDDNQHRARSTGAYKAGARTFLTAPLISNDRVIGAIQLRSKTENAYGSDQVETMKRIANQIAGAFANSLATEQIRVQAAALESAANAIVITDTDGIIEWVNPAFTELCGWSSEEVIGQHVSIMQSTDPADRSINKKIWSALRHGQSWTGTHTGRRKDGTEYPEEITVTPVFDQVGQNTHLIGIKQDITGRVLAEQQQRDTIRVESENYELQRIAAARSEFLATVSHELRTPLTSISAFTDILINSRSENLTGRQKAHLGLVRKSSNQLKSLIDDLLDVSKADSGRLTLNKAKFGLVEMVDDVADLSRVLLSEREQTLELTNLDSPMDLHADRSRVIQILTNLLTNASKFSKNGTVIKLHVASDAEYVIFTVNDQGPGISETDQREMFSPFYRGSSPGVAKTAGSGLGLSVVQSLVDLHEGTITVDSKRGKGSSIIVKLPRTTVETH